MTQLGLPQLRKFIERAERELIFHKSAGNDADELAVLFTGNWHDSIPRNIILNQTLLPVEKLTWQAIRLTVHQPEQPGSTPTRDELAMMVNCSPPTITNARQMLRLLRYTSLCSVVRQQGRFVGEIHLLHDEPMDLGTTLEVDPTYIEFVQSMASASNKSTRVRKEAATILREMHKLGQVPAPEDAAQRMAKRLESAQRMPTSGSEFKTQEHAGFRAEQKSSNVPKDHSQSISDRTSGGNDINTGFHQRKNLSPEHFLSNHQRKNLAPDGNLINSGVFDELHASPVENHQSKNLSPGYFLNDSHQSKILSPAVCSYSSSSLYINILNTRAREDEARDFVSSENNSAAQNLTGAEEFTVDHFPRYTDRAEVENITQAQPEQPSNPKFQTYPEHQPELDYGDQSEIQSLIKRFLPEINHSSLDRYVTTLLLPKPSEIPYLSSVVAKLPAPQRRDVLLQLVSRHAAYMHGWCETPIANPIGFTKKLVMKLRDGEFTPDSFVIEFKSAIDEDREPAIFDSANMIQRRKDLGMIQ